VALQPITEKLKRDYIDIINKFETSIDISSMSLAIPKITAPYQFHYHDLLKEYSQIQDDLDELYHRKMFNVKIANDKLSNIDLNSSELKRMIETDKEYRDMNMKLQSLKNDMKIIEEIISTIKNFSFNVSNSIKYREMMGG
jgi:predicted nuclease with TOPRIM domain